MPVDYDLLIYEDLSAPMHQVPPAVGDAAAPLFGSRFSDHSVVAVGPGIHEGRVTVVLAFGREPMHEIQALLEK